MRFKLPRARLVPALIPLASALMLAALFFLSFNAAIANGAHASGASAARDLPTPTDPVGTSRNYITGEVLVQLVSPALLTEFATKYNLAVKDSRMAPSYRFAIKDANTDEQSLVTQLRADRQYVVWADVNGVSTVPIDPPSGGAAGDSTANPYRTWKWGGDEPTGYRAQYAWEQVGVSPTISAYPGASTIVAVLDTGVDTAHPDLRDHIWPGGIDLISDDNTPQDGPEPGQGSGEMQGHGTHVAGIVLQVAPNAMILPVRVLDQFGNGNTFALAYGIQYAVNHGADVINLSLGAEVDASDNLLRNTIANAIAQGVIVVAAVGNDNSEVPAYPAAFPGVIGVAALDETRAKAAFSNYGADSVDLAAPGVSITSTFPSINGVLYAAWSGTSMAAPFVSGAAARLHEKYPTASPDQIRALLYNNGVSIDDFNTAYTGKLGREINVKTALEYNATQGEVVPTPTPTMTPRPTATPTATPTAAPSATSTAVPTDAPTSAPTVAPTPVDAATPTATPVVGDVPDDATHSLYLPALIKPGS